MNIRSLVLGAGLTVMTMVSSAMGADPPPPPPVALRGTIASIDATSITIAKADGTTVTASIAPTTLFATVEPRRFEQIKATDFVGITNVPGPNDTVKAEEIHIMQKGFNEGSFPWDHRPGVAKPAASSNITSGTVAVVHDQSPTTYTMTNASVTASSGMQLTVTYQGSKMVGGKCVGRAAKGDEKPCSGVAVVEVPPWAPIVAVVPGKSTDAKVGLAVFAVAAPSPQGKPVALSVVVEKNGVKPLW